jgi:hydroxymethylglutaryl-CoA lyase
MRICINRGLNAYNVATEDLLYLFSGLGIKTGIDIYQVVAAGDMICKTLGRKNQSKVANALLAHFK